MTCIRPGDCAVCQESIRDPFGSAPVCQESIRDPFGSARFLRYGDLTPAYARLYAEQEYGIQMALGLRGSF